MNKVEVTENNRFELKEDQSIAFIEFDKIEPNILDLVHTEVPDALEGKGVGSKLVEGALQYSRDNELKIIPSCPFIKSYIDKNPQWKDLIVQK